MRAQRVLRVELTVADLTAAERFYAGLPEMTVDRRDTAEPALAALMGVETIEQSWLRRGGQTLVLQQFTPPGAPYAAERRSCDQAFQHFAMPVSDAKAAVAGLPTAAVPVSRGGAVTLPPSSGGATAYKFRDGEGHPLELIQFADRHAGGIDHSAIVSADVERSIAFYRDTLGLVVGSRQTNRGSEQDRLDDLDDTVVEVVALQPATVTPHIELLAYAAPEVVPAPRLAPNDVAATRLVLEIDRLERDDFRFARSSRSSCLSESMIQTYGDSAFGHHALSPSGAPLADGSRAALIRDPDGHLLLLIQPSD